MEALSISPMAVFRTKTLTYSVLVFFFILSVACDKDDEFEDEVFKVGTYDRFDTYHSFDPANRISGSSVIKLDLEGDELRIGLHYYAGAGYYDFSVYTNSDNWEIAMNGKEPYIFSKGDQVYQVTEWEGDIVNLTGSTWLFTGSSGVYGPYWDYNAPHYLCFRKKERGEYRHLWVHLKVELTGADQYLEIYSYALRGEGRN